MYRDSRDQCGAYQPIALLNTDPKIFTKILATRLLPHMPYLIHTDQSWFVPGRQAADNIRHVLHLMEEAKFRRIQMAVLARDAEKAFDRVGWAFLWSVPRMVRLGPNMLNWKGAYYFMPEARVLNIRELTEAIRLGRGTRQGCPLSPSCLY